VNSFFAQRRKAARKRLAKAGRPACNGSMIARWSWLILFAAIMSGPGANSIDPDELSRIRIYSVLDRGDTLLASTDDGLYTVSKTKKIWRKISTAPPLFGLTKLVGNSGERSELAYFTFTDRMFVRAEKGTVGIELSENGGKTWRLLSLEGNPLDVYLHPDGSIFVAEQKFVPTPPYKNAGAWTFGANGIKQYDVEQLLVSRDKGRTWKDITPPVVPGFGLGSIFQDPDHRHLVCVTSSQIDHTSRDYIFQAADSKYQWKSIDEEKWHHQAPRDRYVFAMIPRGGANNTDLPANLANFFQLPFSRTAFCPEIPTRYLECGASSYRFRLHRPMPVEIRTVCLFGSPLDFWDNKNEKVFWSLCIKPEKAPFFFTEPLTVELNTAYPDHDAKLKAYQTDPDLVKSQIDPAHAYQRTIDLGKLYAFTKPGRYQMQIQHSDNYLFPSRGSTLGSPMINVTVLP
jgi:hypothetical protein